MMIAFLEYSPQFVAIVVLGFILSLATGIGIGGNDIANFFGTAVGTRTLTLIQVIIIASICELVGIMLLGEHVTDSIRKGIVDLGAVIDAYENSTTCLKPFKIDDNIYTPLPENYRGCPAMIVSIISLSALFGSSVWLSIANYFRLPVSTTHSIVGATFGAGLVALEGSTADWQYLGTIVASWVVSPLLSGVLSWLIYWLIYKFVLSRENSFKRALKVLPYFYFFTIFLNIFSIVYDGTPLLGFDKVPWWGVLLLSAGLGSIIAVLTVYVFNGMLVRKIDSNIAKVEFTKTTKSHDSEEQDQQNQDEENIDAAETTKNKDQQTEDPDNRSVITDISKNSKSNNPSKHHSKSSQSDGHSASGSGSGSSSDSDDSDDDNVIVREAKDVRTNYLFQNLQIMMGCFGAFVHGGNDISNAISPLLSIWYIYKDNLIESKVQPPVYILFFGSVGIIVGLSTIGYGVIYTIGKNIAKIAPSSAFCIQFGAALTVLIATRLKIPISTTHCQIGSVVAVGLYRNGKRSLNRRILLSIALSWVLTLPIAGLLAAMAFAGIRQAMFTYNVPTYNI